MNLGETLKRIRKKCSGMNQQDFAKEIGVSNTHLSLVETGKREPRVALINEYVKRFKIPATMVIFLSLDEKDVPIDKLDAFRAMKPIMNNIINDLFGLN